MDKIKKYIKTHKKKCTVIAIILVIVIIALVVSYLVIDYLMPNTRESVYGDRCDITENHPVASDRKGKIEEFLKDYDKMTLVDLDVKCNLIDVVIKVQDDETVANVKAMGKNLLKVFSEDEIKYYDIELLVGPEKENKDLNMIGSHHKEIDGSSNEDFVW